MIRRFLVLLVAGLLAASGCANGTLSEEAAEDLQQRADAVRAAAEARDVDAAEQALTGLRAALDAHVEADAVSPGRAREIATAADAVEARLALIEGEVEEVPADEQPPVEEPPTTEPPPPSTTVPEPDPEPEPDDDKDDKDDDKDDEDQGGGDQEDEGGGDDRGPDGEGPPGQSRAG